MGKPVVELVQEEIGTKIASLLLSEESLSQVELAHMDSRAYDIKAQRLHGIPGYENGSIVTFHDVTEREDLYHQVKELATRDSLTGVYNRGAFLERGVGFYASSAFRDAVPLSAIMLDIDHFKDINDTYGHDAGDTTLTFVAKTCIRLIRTQDIVGRLGGDEFALLLPETTHESALAVARTIHQTLQDQVVIATGHAFHIKVSLGVASTMMDGTKEAPNNLTILLSNADSALYQAKNQGRGRVVAFNDRNNGLQ
jgi:diguanylate cyclase (GGDEF)-like protein